MGKHKRSFHKLLMNTGWVKPQVILLMDGGVCSQMHQYLLGALYQEKGYEVAYDMSFFETWGSDLQCRFVRNFDLIKAFPYLKLKESSEMAIEFYKRKYYYGGNNSGERIDDYSFLTFTPPVYLGGYYHLPPDIWLKKFRELYRLSDDVLDKGNTEIRECIAQKPCSIAVHVRRGDLAQEVYSYGKPATNEYFSRAIDFFRSNHESPFFYFFSDEPEWVRNELLTKLAIENCAEVIDINGSDKGYMDLYLIAECTHQITSKGTLGKYGALLNDNVHKQVVLCDDATEYPWKNLFYNPIYI